MTATKAALEWMIGILVLAYVLQHAEAQIRRNQGFLRSPSQLDAEEDTDSSGDLELASALPNSGQVIRLRGSRGRSHNVGRLEVFLNKRWGPVCDDFWNVTDASVACRMLGYVNGAYGESVGSEFGVDQWTENSINMDDVKCQGYEKSLFQCQHQKTHDCKQNEFAGVKCIVNSGCPAGRFAVNGTCYQFIPEPASYVQASMTCERLGGRLASVEFHPLNNFLSDLLFAITDSDSVYVFGQKDVVTEYSRVPTFGMYSNFIAGASKSTSRNCVTLSKRQDSRMLDYYHVSLSECNQKLPYVCAIAAATQDCYNEDGANYRGTASRTDSGRTCDSWARSKVTASKYPGKGIGAHNHCRNPDGDSKPWCWVNATQNTYGYCAVSKCSAVAAAVHSNAPTNMPPITAMATPMCGSNEFPCNVSGACIARSFYCDGRVNCPHGEDEKSCPSVLSNFKKSTGKLPLSSAIAASYYNTPLEQCARICTMSRTIVCFSFAFRRNADFCSLYSAPTSSIGLVSNIASSEYDFYEHKSHINDCSNLFKCSNNRCVARSLRCNGANDCNDFSDEEGCSSSPQQPVQLRFAAGMKEHSGMVEIQFNGEWGIICDDKWGIADAKVVCQQMGYVDALDALGSIDASLTAENFMLDEVECKGNEKSIADCEHSPWKQHDCRSHEAAGVVCQVAKACSEDELKCANGKCVPAQQVCDKIDDCGDSSDEKQCTTLGMSLVGGSGLHEGRVEVTYSGLRGTICDDEFDEDDARVICRSFGYDGAAIAHGSAKFGAGKGPIWMDDLRCSGDERHIAACPRSSWATNDCSHSEDAAVTCFAAKPSTQGRLIATTRIPITAVPTRSFTTTRPHSSSSAPASASMKTCGQRFFRSRRASITSSPLGTRYVEPSGKTRIVGGRDAVHGAYPWQVGVKLGLRHWCGGTVLSEHWVLSAAHCYFGRPKSAFRIVVGDYDIDTTEVTEQPFELEQIIIHENYDGSTNDHDFALLKVVPQNSKGIAFSRHVQPACLPTSQDQSYPTGLYCHISGWGATSKNSYPSILKSAEVPIMDDGVCSYLYKNEITRQMFCAGFKEGGIDTCQGDSGGPLVCELNGRFTVLGATSFGYGCAEPNAPGVYARVSAVLPWIEKQMQN